MNLLGVRLDNLNLAEVLQKITGFLADGQQHFIVLPYAEFLVKAQEEEEFKKILNRADLCLPEGFGVILGSHILGEPLKGRVIGVELVETIVKEFGKNHSVFFFGAKEGVAAEAAERLEQKFSGIKSIGTLNGFVGNEEVIAKINETKSEVLLVGLGMPKQEKWIAENLSKMPSVKLAVGVGGAFDFISGRIPRAPKIFQKLGLEWFWRFAIQPWRIKIIFRSVVIFLWLVVKEKIMKNYRKTEKIHFVGIGGIGISALAQYFLAQGAEISGSDVAENESIENLRKLGAKILPTAGHRPENLPKDADVVIYSAAVEEDNPELLRAKELGIPTKLYAEALGELTKKMFTIAVSGMHGKSTTTAMIGLIMEKAGLDPTVIVGTKVRWGSADTKIPPNPSRIEYGTSSFLKGGEKENNFRAGKSKYLVIEADEYNASFLNYWPKILVLLNIEEEHLDTYKDLEDIMKTFEEYIGRLPEEGILVANKEDGNVMKLVKNLELKVKSYSSKLKIEKLNLKVSGRHNLSNAMAALTAARVLGIKDEISIETLNEFPGTWRRMEYRGKLNGARIFDDYGHHPTEIKATLEGAKELLEKNGQLWLIFQPHQYQRLYKLFDKFTEAFGQADKLILLPVFSVPGRESEEIKGKVNSEKLAEEIKKMNYESRIMNQEILYLENFEKAEKYLKENLKENDICVIMGAGDIYKLTQKLI